MTFLNLKIAWQAMKRKPLRTFLTVLQIALGVAVVVVCINLSQQMTMAVEEEYGDLPQLMRATLMSPADREKQKDLPFLMLTGPAKRYFLLDDYKRVKAADIFPHCSIHNQYRDVFLRVGSQNYALYRLHSGDVDLPAMLGLELLEGDFFTPADIASAQHNVIIEKSVALQLFGSIEKALGQTIGIRQQQMVFGQSSFGEIIYRVIGIFKDPTGSKVTVRQDPRVIVPFTSVPSDEYPLSGQPFYVQLAAGTGPKDALEALESLFLGWQGWFALDQVYSSLDELLAEVGHFSFIWGVFAFIALLVASISILSTNMGNIAEQGKDIGLRRSLGAGKAAVMRQVLLESSLYAFCGWPIGLLLGYYSQLVFFIGSRAPFALPYSAKSGLTVVTVISTLALALAAGVLFGLYPAWQAAQVSPIEVLKDE